MAWQGLARQGKVSFSSHAMIFLLLRGTARRGMARLGPAWQGKVSF